MKERFEPKYSLYVGTSIASRILGVEPRAFLSRAGLDPNPSLHEANGVTAQEFHMAWSAMVDEYPRDDAPLVLGRELARGSFIPAMLALTWAPDFETGIRRLDRYKRLIGPSIWRPEARNDGLAVIIEPLQPDAPIPPSMLLMQCVFIVETLRLCTQTHVVPRRVSVRDLGATEPSLRCYFGVSPTNEESTLVVAPKDARRPFVSAHPGLWERFTQDLDVQVDQFSDDLVMRARTVLRRNLPHGHVSLQGVGNELGMSPRALQRGLADIGVSFKEILDSTRLELAKHYLTMSALRNDEISYLLGFQKPGSFYRAFKAWTGLTPSDARLQWRAE
ncbi:MAG: helix-turn-helix domain-containing protein [Myxococcota bacterium]